METQNALKKRAPLERVSSFLGRTITSFHYGGGRAVREGVCVCVCESESESESVKGRPGVGRGNGDMPIIVDKKNEAKRSAHAHHNTV